MQIRSIRKTLSCILCSVLIAAAALTVTGCTDSNAADTTAAAETTSVSDTSDSASVTVIGEGANIFAFTVADIDGNEEHFEVHTDKTVVGEALLELGMISGDESEFGLYVKTVNGITADYDKDGAYWAFYVDGEYALSGVDTTEIAEGAVYSFRIEKA